jgi:sortase A
MARQRSVESLSADELRQLLIKKRRSERQARLENYRHTGRVIDLEPERRPQPVSGRPQPALGRQQSFDNSSDTPPVETVVPAPANPRHVWADRLLLAIEIVGVLGLIFVLLNGASLLNALNHEVATALQPPALTPTPLIEAVVLPGGHTPPNSPDGARPNDAEIPANLRARVQAIADIPVPTASPQSAQRIRIPAINVDAAVVQGDSWEDLKRGVGQHVSSADPGENGNLVLSAHNDIYGEIFRDLDKLQAGDEIIIATSQQEFVYTVQQVQIVDPTRTDLMASTQEAVTTLISCYPYMVDNKRIVVTAYLQQQP